MLYEGVLILGMNEFCPVNSVELLYMSVTIMISVVLQSLVFGNISVLSQTS